MQPGSIYRILLLGLILTANTTCIGQDLLVFKLSRSKQVFYKEGDEISFRIKSDKIKITSQIKGFRDSLIVFKYYNVSLDEISHIFTDKKIRIWYPFRYKYAKIFPILGAGYLFADVINSGELDLSTIFISSGLIGTGLVARLIIGNKIKIKRKGQLKILSSSPLRP